MSVDVEDYFQVSAFEQNVERSEWDSLPCRVESNTDRTLELFERHGVKATFFTLGWVAERYPHLVKRIVAAGHELASHGWQHTRVTQQTAEEFLEDVTRTRQLLQDLSGQPVIGYRAASYSINASNQWAWSALQEAGYEYSSSIVPVKHDLYGMPDAPRFAFTPETSDILEIPITTVPLAGRNINCGGGGWFRLFPYGFSRWAHRRVNESEGQSTVFYFHPWEVDPEQPPISGASMRSRFRHYLNLSKMEPRLERLLGDFQWDRVDRVFLKREAA